MARFRRRLRRHAAARLRPPGSPEDEVLCALVARQTQWWEDNPPIAGARRQGLLESLNSHSRSIFVFSVRDRRVALWPKTPAPVYSLDWAAQARQWDGLCVRALLYQAYLEHVLAHSPEDLCFDMALDVNDIPQDSRFLPVFAFQRQSAARNLMLPDVDFFDFDWYAGEPDPYDYDAKTASACFVGASTGRWLTQEAVDRRLTPRLRSAAHFCTHPHVTFRISSATQCADRAVERLLRRQPYFGPPMNWTEQLGHRLLISMDGNGATCSRVARALRSNSALVKYASDFELYYFAALRAREHFLPVETDADVERIVDDERGQPGRFKSVAEAGRGFAERFLTPAHALAYTSLMLSRFARL